MKWSTVPSSEEEQLKLFREFPLKLKYLEKVPNCGVCKKNAAKYHAPTKFGIWADICDGCAEANTDSRFSLGYKILKYLGTEKMVLEAVEMTDISVVVVLGERQVACPLCRTEREVSKDSTETFICASCQARVKVGKLF
jgi:hypothetical protein